jgi:branched-chain amino acid transport system substrate-binding protein
MGTKEMLPVLANIRRSGADVVVLQLHSGPSALFVRQAAAFGLKLPIVGGSALHQPTTVALVEPASLKNVCAETASSPISESSPAFKAFVAAFRKAYGAEPDAFALADYDAVGMLLTLRRKGIKTGPAMRKALATTSYQGLAMTYRSDGKGNMAHDAVIVCYDGKSRVPQIVKRYRIDLAENTPR